jgi:hypothetical protein
MSRNIKLKAVITKRHIESWPSWDVVFEWEDVISDMLKIPVISLKNSFYRKVTFEKRRIQNLFNSLHYLVPIKKSNPDRRESLFLFFQMNIMDYVPFSRLELRSIVPYIIDSFIDKGDVNQINIKYSSCPLVLISSLEVFEFLKLNNCSLNISFLPLSISDKYKVQQTLVAKEFDVVLAGRTNPTISGYIDRYLESNPDIEIVYRKKIENGDFIYCSNKRGEIGNIASRGEYMNLLKRSRIGVYATPGMGDELRSKSMNPVTPRYLELLAAQCHILALYPNTIETTFFELDRVCQSLDSYELFEKAINEYLVAPVDVDKYNSVLDKFYTSKRAIELNEIFNSMTRIEA